MPEKSKLKSLQDKIYTHLRRCEGYIYKLDKEFDPGSGRTLAARLTHASRTDEGELALLS